MMTWMTRVSLFDSALDMKLPELTLAHSESESLFNELVFGEANGEHGAAPKPLVMMWFGYETALAGYSVACAATLVSYGVTTGVRSAELARTMKEMRDVGDPAPFIMPPWSEDIDVLRSHRSNMMRRWPERYNWPRTPARMPYLWPIVDGDGGYVLKLSKYDKDLLAKKERSLPKDILERIQE